MFSELTRAEDLANAWDFVRSHRAEIDAQIKACDRDDEVAESFLQVDRSLNLEGPPDWSSRLND